MELSVWLTYLVTTIVLSVTPGPGVFSSVASGLNHGFRRGIWNGVGMQVANLVLAALVSFGLGAILLASETAFAVVKWLGVAYLVYLGVITWRAAPQAFARQMDTTRTPWEIFLRGFLVSISNPKGIIFFAAILPQFIDIARPQLAQYAILTATTFTVDVFVMAGYTAAAARVVRVMRNVEELRWINRGLGGLFVAAGVALAGWRRSVSAL